MPHKIWECKKPSKIWRHFWQLSTLIANISETGHKSKIGKVVDQRQPLPRWTKKDTWTLVHKRKSYSRAYWPTRVNIFRETIFWPLGGAMLQNFSHALEIDQGYLANTPTGTGVPPKNFNRENLKFGLKFSVCTSMTSGLMGISSQIFIQTTWRELGVIMWAQFLDGLSPKIWDGEKRSKSGAISDNFRLYWYWYW